MTLPTSPLASLPAASAYSLQGRTAPGPPPRQCSSEAGRWLAEVENPPPWSSAVDNENRRHCQPLSSSSLPSLPTVLMHCLQGGTACELRRHPPPPRRHNPAVAPQPAGAAAPAPVTAAAAKYTTQTTSSSALLPAACRLTYILKQRTAPVSPQRLSAASVVVATTDEDRR